MSASISGEPNVELLIEGIIVLGFERNEAGEIVACLAGAVANVPDHEFSVIGRKVDANEDVQDFTFDNTQPNFSLETAATTQQGISFVEPDAVIDRIAGTGSPNSFAWVLNFSELHNHSIPVDKTKFSSLLRITTGQFFTSVISVNHLLAQDAEKPKEPLTLVGKVATEVGLTIRLDNQPESVARFSDGVTTVEVKHGEKLFLIVKQTCPHDSLLKGGLQVAHANHYYDALGVEASEKKSFSSTKFVQPESAVNPPVSPEASCLVGRVGP